VTINGVWFGFLRDRSLQLLFGSSLISVFRPSSATASSLFAFFASLRETEQRTQDSGNGSDDQAEEGFHLTQRRKAAKWLKNQFINSCLFA